MIVGDETYRFTKGVFTFEPMDPTDVKGKRDPILPWLVGEAVGQPAFRRPSSTPLVGRRRELQTFRDAWERVVATTEPHLFTVLGPPGIGKTLASPARERRTRAGRGAGPLGEQPPIRRADAVPRRLQVD